MLTAVLKVVKDAVTRTQGPCVAVPQRPATHRLISVVLISLYNLPYYYEYHPLKLSSAPHLPLPLVKEKQNQIVDCTGIRKHFVTQIGYLLDEHVFLVA
jgi:hypothetical protein